MENVKIESWKKVKVKSFEKSGREEALTMLTSWEKSNKMNYRTFE